jgi:YHYH protein
MMVKVSGPITARRGKMAALAALALSCALAAAGCGGGDDGAATPATATSTAASEAPDLTALPLGDEKVVTDGPKRGYIYSCMSGGGGGGAEVDGPWIDQSAGTFNLNQKVVVPGKVSWDGRFEIKLNGDVRDVTGNDLPDHTTGEYPIPSDSEAYSYDRNPNSIAEQEVALELPANPTEAPEASCMGGEVGILTSGVALFNGLDATNRDAVAHEVQDHCQGHPQVTSIYHYHSQSSCLPDNQAGEGHSPLIGYALDGFGIYGHQGEDGATLSNADLDQCHGHTHEIEWDGKMVSMYHYHSTYEYPYTVSCFRGDPAQLQVIPGAGGGGGGAPEAGAGGPPAGAPPG